MSHPVSRILYFPGWTRESDDHPSGRTIAGRLKQLPTDSGEQPSIIRVPAHRAGFLPCSRWGLHSRAGHPARWCALTAPFHPYQVSLAVYFLLHCPAGCPGLPLATTVLFGVRTFLVGVPARVCVDAPRRDRLGGSFASYTLLHPQVSATMRGLVQGVEVRGVVDEADAGGPVGVELRDRQ